MRLPQIDDVVPFRADDLGPEPKIQLMHVSGISDADEVRSWGTGWQDEDFAVEGRILRRSYFGNEALVIDDGDVWSDGPVYVIGGSDLLPSRPIEYKVVWGDE